MEDSPESLGFKDFEAKRGTCRNYECRILNIEFRNIYAGLSVGGSAERIEFLNHEAHEVHEGQVQYWQLIAICLRPEYIRLVFKGEALSQQRQVWGIIKCVFTTSLIPRTCND
ncbi:MAG TPA: hypothetical protein DCZ94_11445 [Lentisphaeria bacterium]|nr:hypothetical protein [Lentisphaeria bacterium]